MLLLCKDNDIFKNNTDIDGFMEVLFFFKQMGSVTFMVTWMMQRQGRTVFSGLKRKSSFGKTYRSLFDLKLEFTMCISWKDTALSKSNNI